MSNIEIKKNRLAVIYFAILFAFSLIILRMVYVVVMGDKVMIKNIYDPGKNRRRGNIFDRNGVLVATDLKTKSLYVSSVLVKDPKKIASELSKIFSNLSFAEILKKIADGKNSKQWILIRRNLTPLQVEQVQNLHMAGLLFQDDSVRIYPQKSISSHYTGYVDLDRKGLSGIEMQYDRKLSLQEDLHLAMDVRAQDILHDELMVGVEQYHAKAAAGIILDVNTGEILALSSIPSFDANLQSEASSEQRFNRVVNGVYELGSVMKIFTNALAFEENLIKLDDSFDVHEPIRYGRFTIKDDHPFKDKVTVEEIFSHSSNIGTVKIAEKIGISNQKDFLEKMGFFKKMDIEFPGLGRPIFPKTWREINLYTISYGHGIAITPLHLASAVAAIANGGIYYKPSFLKLEKEADGKRVIDESTSQKMKILFKKVIDEGTGKSAKVEGYEVGGKTGTAERAEFGSYNERQTLASFVAIFPISKPKYLVYVIFDRPNYIFNTAGIVAAPVAGKVVKNIAPILRVKPVQQKEDVIN